MALSKRDQKNLEAFVVSLNIDAQIVRNKIEAGETAEATAALDTLQLRLTNVANYFDIKTV